MAENDSMGTPIELEVWAFPYHYARPHPAFHLCRGKGALRQVSLLSHISMPGLSRLHKNEAKAPSAAPYFAKAVCVLAKL